MNTQIGSDVGAWSQGIVCKLVTVPLRMNAQLTSLERMEIMIQIENDTDFA